MDIEATLRKHEDFLMGLPNVVGVGIGERAGKEVITVFVTHKVPAHTLATDEIVPKTLDGYETDVEEIGYISAQ